MGFLTNLFGQRTPLEKHAAELVTAMVRDNECGFFYEKRVKHPKTQEEVPAVVVSLSSGSERTKMLSRELRDETGARSGDTKAANKVFGRVLGELLKKHGNAELLNEGRGSGAWRFHIKDPEKLKRWMEGVRSAGDKRVKLGDEAKAAAKHCLLKSTNTGTPDSPIRVDLRSASLRFQRVAREDIGGGNVLLLGRLKSYSGRMVV